MKPAVTTIVALALLTFLPSPASAGIYDVWSCAGPAGEPLPASGWVSQVHGGTTFSTCGRRHGSLYASLGSAQQPNGTYARWIFDAPTNTTIARVTVYRAASGSRLSNWGRAYFLFRDAPIIAEGYGLDVCVGVSLCSKAGTSYNVFSEANRYTSPWMTAGRLIASVQCDGTEPCPARDAPEIGTVAIYRARISLADAFPPTFRSPLSGSLLDAANVVGGLRTVSFHGADLGAGIRAAEVVVDGQAVVREPVTDARSCGEPYPSPVPCPLTARRTITVDTASLANGSHRIQTALVDAANNRTLSDPITVNVHNDKGPNGVNASRAVKLRASFRSSRGSRHAERRVAFGRRPSVVGRLVTRAGAPVRGAELLVTTRIDRLGARDRATARITTGTNGRFRWRPPRGPSRFLRITYRAYESDVAPTAATELKLSVRPKIALSVRPHSVHNGGSIVFAGRLKKGPGRAGTQVVLEAVGRSARQRVPVANLRADRRGRFRFRYRFLRSFAPFTYRFRARLIPQASYPYAAGSSRVVTVRIVR